MIFITRFIFLPHNSPICLFPSTVSSISLLHPSILSSTPVTAQRVFRALWSFGGLFRKCLRFWLFECPILIIRTCLRRGGQQHVRSPVSKSMWRNYAIPMMHGRRCVLMEPVLVVRGNINKSMLRLVWRNLWWISVFSKMSNHGLNLNLQFPKGLWIFLFSLAHIFWGLLST